MADIKGKILTAEEEQGLLKPIDEFVGGIQEEINALRADGTDRVTSLTNHIAIIRENANYSKAEKAAIIAKDRAELQKAKLVEKQHSAEIKKLIGEAVGHLDAHYDSDYYAPVAASCELEKAEENSRYAAELVQLEKEHTAELAKLTDKHEIKDEKYVYKLGASAAPTVTYGQKLGSTWTEMTSPAQLTPGTNTKITVASIDANGRAQAAGVSVEACGATKTR